MATISFFLGLILSCSCYAYDEVIWTQVDDQMDGYVQILGSYNDCLYAGTDKGLFRMQGEDWVLVSKLGISKHSSSLFRHNTWHQSGDYLYVDGAGGGILRTKDVKNWSAVINGLTGRLSRPAIIRSLCEYQGYLYAGSQFDGLFRSKDGENWQAVIATNHLLEISSLCLFKECLYLGDKHSGGVLKSKDGVNWVLAKGLENTSIYTMCLYEDCLYVGTDCGVFSTEDGENWSQVAGLEVYGPHSSIIMHLQPHDGYLYAVSDKNGISRSKDGESWVKLQSNMDDESIRTLYSYKGDLYAGAVNGVFKLDKNPKLLRNWQAIALLTSLARVNGELVTDVKSAVRESALGTIGQVMAFLGAPHSFSRSASVIGYQEPPLLNKLRNAMEKNDIEGAIKILQERYKPNELLKFAVTQVWRENDRGHISCGVPLGDRQIDLIKLALSQGAKFSDFKIDRFIWMSDFPSLQTAEFMLQKGLDPNDLINLIISRRIDEVDDDLISKRDALIKYALDKGADANRLLNVLVTNMAEYKSDIGASVRVITKPIELIKMALARKAKFSAIKIKYSHSLPDQELVRVMLEDPSGPDLLLQLVALGDFEMDPGRFMNNAKLKKELIERRESMAVAAVKKGANPNKIRYFGSPLSLELSALLFKIGMGPDVYFDLVAKIVCVSGKKKIVDIDKTLVKQRDELINFALYNGAKRGKIDGFDRAGFIELANQVFDGNGNIKANINLANKDGKTLLMLVAEGGYLYMTEIFLGFGADRKLKDKNGKTALDLARARGNANKYLEEILS